MQEIKIYISKLWMIEAGHVFKACPKCALKRIIGWGYYYRKSVKGSDKNRIAIHRYRCKDCGVTFSYLPPFLIRYKRYYLPYIESVIEAILVQGKSYVKGISGTIEIEVSTVISYCQYFIEQAGRIHETISVILQETVPDYRYEKDPRLYETDFQKNVKNRHNRDQFRKAYILAQTVREIIRERQSRLNDLSTLTWIQYQLMISQPYPRFANRAVA